MKSNIDGYPWRLFIVLWLASILATLSSIPYATWLLQVASHPPELPRNVWVIYCVRNALLGALFVALGLLLSRRVKLGVPYVQAWIYDLTPESKLRSIAPSAVGWAVLISIAVFAIDAVFYFALNVAHPAPETHARIPPGDAWRGILLSFYAAIYEELKYRLFMMSLAAWILIKLFRAEEGRGRTIAFWIAVLASTAMFAWSHVTGIELFGPASPIVLFRTLLIILVPGLVFGYLFWKRGLEAAILCHFAVDIIVHVIRPWVERTML